MFMCRRICAAAVGSACLLPAASALAGWPVSAPAVAACRFDLGGQWAGPGQDRFLAMAAEYGVQLYNASQCESARFAALCAPLLQLL